MKRIGMIQLLVEHHEISEAVYTSFRGFPVRRCFLCIKMMQQMWQRHLRQADDAEVEASAPQRMVLFQRSGLLPEDLGADGAALKQH